MGRNDNKYTDEARQALAYAREETQRLRYRVITTEHLLLGILKVSDPIIEGLFATLHTSATRIFHALEFVTGRGTKAILGDPSFGPAARATLVRAEEEAALMKADLVGIEHILLGILGEQDGVAAGVLESFGVSASVARQLLVSLANGDCEDILISTHYQALYDATPALNQVSRDLTMAALTGTLDPLIGRENELERTMQILARRSKNNPVLLGPAGVGKTAIAEGLALRIIQKQVPEHLHYARVVALETGLLTVGTKFRGDFEERLKLIMREVVSNPGIIVVIDELHSLVSTGVAEGSIDASNLFKPMLARGEFQCIGATTLDNYRKSIETDPALERRFQPVLVSETDPQETLEILRGLRSRYADYHQVTISDEALSAAVQMSSRYVQSRFQPDKAIDLLDEAAARICVQRALAPELVQQHRERVVAVQREKDHAITDHDFPTACKLLKRERLLREELWRAEYEWHQEKEQDRPLVAEQDIAEIVAMWTGIPVMQLAKDEALKLLSLEDELHQRVVGQHKAVRAVARAVRRSRAKLQQGRRPVGSFLFVGPTGVGKTELARALATSLFHDEGALLKLDMSEFMESHHASRLLGSPPGYVGYDQGGQLTDAVRRRPYSVILFDEIEKAHPKVHDLLLQILEDGSLTDSHGLTADFRHTVIIITSNAGTGQLEHSDMSFANRQQSEPKRREERYEQVRARALHAISDAFRPELLNRLDEVIVFHPLHQEHLRAIVDMLVEQTTHRVEAQQIQVQVSEAARLLLVERGYDREYGARPLRRAVQSMLEDMLAEAILHGTLNAGDAILVDVSAGKLAIQVPAVV